MKRNRAGFLVGDKERECTKCSEIFTITSKTVTMCPACNTERVKSSAPEAKMLRRAKERAKKFNMEFNLELNDISIPPNCPVLGFQLVVSKGRSGGAYNSPALDRMDNAKGYIKGNVMVISHLANQMKASANKNQLVKFANWVLSTTDQENEPD